MVISRLLPALLVLLQSGLAATAHEHAGHAPHAHVHDLLDLVAPGEPAPEPDGDHDADAVYFDALTAGPPAPTADAVAVDLSIGSPARLAATTDPDTFSPGLPPPTAGRSRPLYLSHCALRN